MEKKVVVLGNKGMYQDSAISKSSDEFAFENYNIRITAVNDETLFAVTNEKGPAKVDTKDPQTSYSVSLLGQYVGGCVLDDKMVIFTHEISSQVSTPDHIYVFSVDWNHPNCTYEVRTIYSGNLNFSGQKIKALGCFESASTQKVYFVDGENPNRVVNICDEYTYQSGSPAVDTQFDFVPTVSQIPQVTITKTYGGNGKFPAGTVQYFISYFNKLGAETKVVWASDLQYASLEDRGGKADETVNCNFNLSISDVDTSFDYLRVYSAKRASLDGPLEVSIVSDIQLDSNSSTVTIVDDNIDNISQDSNILSFIGGDSFIASTIEQKDNVAFFGDISSKNIVVDSSTRTALQTELSNKFSFIYSEEEDINTGEEYWYENSLNNSQKAVTSFKGGEWYRIGIQLQSTTFEWSEPIFICDLQNTLYPVYEEGKKKVPLLSVSSWDDSCLLNTDWKSYRIVIVEPKDSYRTILAQGIINPTVFGYSDRVVGNTFSLPSYISRPFTTGGVTQISNFRHLESVSNTGNLSDLAELQLIETSKTPIGEAFSGSIKTYTIVFTEQVKYNWANSTPHSPAKKWYDYKANCFLLSSTTKTATDLYNDYINLQQQTASTDFIVEGTKSYSGNTESSDIYSLLRKCYEKCEEWLSSTFGIMLSDFLMRQEFTNSNDRNHPGTTSPNSWRYMTLSGVANFQQNKVGSSKFYNTGELNTNSYFKTKDVSELNRVDVSDYVEQYYVDNSIVTLNSPDLSNKAVLPTNISLRIAGIVEASNIYNDFLLEVDNGGEYSQNLRLSAQNYLLKDLLYRGYAVAKDGDPDEGEIFSNTPNEYYVYLWEKQKSIIGETEPSPAGNYHSVLKHKIFSNYTYCSNWKTGVMHEYEYLPENGFGAALCDDTDELVKLPSGNYYRPSVDILVDGTNGYTVDSRLRRVDPSDYDPPVTQYDPARIKYKNSKHVAMELGNITLSGTEYINTLPFADKDYIDITYGDNNQLTWEAAGGLAPENTVYRKTTSRLPWDERKYFSSSFNFRDSGAYVEGPTAILSSPYFYIGELFIGTNTSPYGNTTDDVLQQQVWIPASFAYSTGDAINETWGDTYFQRWECLRAYPTTENDENSVIDIVSFMVESHINLDGRCDVNRGPTHLNLKRPTNTNLMNEVYSQKDNVFAYTILDDRFDEQHYPNQFTWSLAKSPMQLVDNWTNATLTNVENVDGQYGPIREICKLNDTLLVFQDKAICAINFNNRTQISTEQGLPIELANSGKVQGITYITTQYGCKDKHSIVNTKSGIYFFDANNRAFVKIDKEGISEVSKTSGMSVWFKNIKDSAAVMCHYDKHRGDIYIVLAAIGAGTEDTCLVYNEQLGTFTSFFDLYSDSKSMFSLDNYTYYCVNDYDGGQEIKYVSLYEMFSGDYSNDYHITYRVNPEPLINKTFTNGEYIADYLKEVVLPDSNDTLTAPFDTVRVWTEYQDTGDTPIKLDTGTYGWKHNPGSVKPKFRITRFDIPKVSASETKKWKKDRISNPWMYLKLSKDLESPIPQADKMIFHSLAITYYK